MPGIDDKKRANLIRLLYDKTVAGDLRWKPTHNDDEFRVSFDTASVVIRDEKDNWGNTFHYSLRVYNKTGLVVDDVNLDRFVTLNAGFFEDLCLSAFLKPDEFAETLYNTARGSALNVGGVYDSVLNALAG